MLHPLLTSKEFEKIIEDAKIYSYFVHYNSNESISQGYKLSIQGTTVEDILYLWDQLKGFLFNTKCCFKFATPYLLNTSKKEQRSKILTIYIPDNVDPKSFAHLVNLHIKDYKGGENVEHKVGYTKFNDSIYYRNDRDENGKYIYPQDMR